MSMRRRQAFTLTQLDQLQLWIRKNWGHAALVNQPRIYLYVILKFGFVTPYSES